MNTVFVFKMATSFPGFLCYPLYDACSVATISRRVLPTRVNPDTCRIRVACERQTFLLARRSQARIRVDGQIRFEYGYVSTRKFLNPQRKICGLKKYPDKVYTSTNNEDVNYVPLSQPTSSVQISDSILSRDNLSLTAYIKAWVLAAWRTTASFSLN